jgi:IS605 OrfB family transposase
MKMSFQTYCFELLQTRGEKGKALRRAMQLWTTTVAKFLEMAADRHDELDDIINGTSANKALKQWVYDNLKLIPELNLMEPTMKHAVYRTLDSQLRSYFALKKSSFEPGFPTGRVVQEDDFAALLDEFTSQGHILTPESEYVTLAGLVSGCGRKSEYLPLDFYYYKPEKGFFIAKSKRGNYFAAMYIEPGNAGFTPKEDDLTIVWLNEKVVARKKPCRLFPLAMNKWLQRRLETYRPATGRVIERKGRYFLNVVFEVPDRQISEPDKIIGVDLGKKRIAAVSVLGTDGRWLESASVEGLHVNQIKQIAMKTAKAQSRGGRYKFPRYGRISKEIVHITVNKIIELASANNAVVVIEELSGLRRANSSAGKSARNHGRKSNTYGLFKDVMTYKCKAAGIQIDMVSAAYTSQTCPMCGHIDPKNRLVRIGDKITRHKFHCTKCGFDHANSDEIAAINIGRKYLYKKECIETKKKSKSAINRGWQDFIKQMCAG